MPNNKTLLRVHGPTDFIIFAFQRNPIIPIRILVLVALVSCCWGAALSPTMQPILGGTMSWSIDPKFMNGGMYRRVTFELSTAFEVSARCTYAVGSPVECCPSTGSCSGTQSFDSVSNYHGVLCVIPIKNGWVGDSAAYQGGTSDTPCSYFANVTTQAVVKYGLVNAFTCLGKYVSQDVTSFSRLVNNVSVVTGVLTHTVTLDDDTVGLVAYLAGPQGTVIGWSQGLLLPQCPGGITGNLPTGQTCSYNTFDPQMRWGTRRNNVAGSVAAYPSFQSSADAYWRQFSSSVKLSSADGPSASWSLQQQTPALETFVPVCAATDCQAANPIKNYYSPSPFFPPFIEVAVTAKTRAVLQDSTRSSPGWYGPKASSFPATIPPLLFPAFDYDGFLLAVYNPAFNGATEQNFSADVFTGNVSGPDLFVCFGGVKAGRPCTVSADCDSATCAASWQSRVCMGGPLAAQSCSDQSPPTGVCGAGSSCSANWNNGRLTYDFDRNAYNSPGANIKLDFSWLDPATNASAKNLTLPLYARRFTQHVLGVVDQPFIDVDNPNATLAVGDQDANVVYPPASGQGLWTTGSGFSQVIFSSYGCDAGTANQPPQFVVSLNNPLQSRSVPLPTNFTCYWDTPCKVTVYAADFMIDSHGNDLNKLSTDRVGIELAFGASQEDNSELVEVDSNGQPVNSGITGCTGPIDAQVGSPDTVTGIRGCQFTITGSSANPIDNTGMIFVKCFTAFDMPGGVQWTNGQAKTCRSLPYCVKVRMEGHAPYFVAPTPGFDSVGNLLPIYSRDDLGQLVPGRTDVPACLGYPVNLFLAAQDNDGQNTSVRIFAYDADVDHSLYSDVEYPYLNSGGKYNSDFMRSQLGSSFPSSCGVFSGYGAMRLGDNSGETSIAAMKPIGGIKSVMSPYMDSIEYSPGAAYQQLDFSLSLVQQNGIALRTPSLCGAIGMSFPSCGEEQLNMDQVVCAFAYDNSRMKTGRWVGSRNPNGNDLPSWRRDHSNGDYVSQQHCWKIVMQAPPVFVSDLQGGCSSSECYATPFAEDWFSNANYVNNQISGSQGYIRHIRVAVGYTFSVTLVAQDPNVGDEVSITILEDTGIPLGMHVGDSTCISRGLGPLQGTGGHPMCAGIDIINPPNFYNTDLKESLNVNASSLCSRASLTLSWAPSSSEAGNSFRVCAMARDDSVECQGIATGSTSSGWYGNSLCYEMDVVQAEIFWLNVYETFNLVEAYVGCKGIIQASAADESVNPLSVDEQGNYPLIINVSGTLPPGAVLGSFQRPANTTAVQSVVWFPEHGSEGLQFEICFRVSDIFSQDTFMDGYCAADYRACVVANLGSDCVGVQMCKPACSTAQVARCRYCVSAGDTLSTIMRKISLDSNWLRLWALNGNEDMETNVIAINNPDLLSQITASPLETSAALELVSDGLAVPMAKPLPNPEFWGNVSDHGTIMNISAEVDTSIPTPGSRVERRRVYVGVTYRVKVNFVKKGSLLLLQPQRNFPAAPPATPCLRLSFFPTFLLVSFPHSNSCLLLSVCRLASLYCRWLSVSGPQ